MATTNNNPVPAAGVPNEAVERDQAKKLAERYRCPFVDLREQRIDPELFRSIPAEMMFRYNFVPLEGRDGTLVVAIADPSQLQLTDELALLLGKRLQIKVATPSQIGDLLKRTEQSQRVLHAAGRHR
jgi:type IV pilus assembly protein PilB